MAHKKPFELIDVTLRDAHQCLWSTRMTTPHMYPALADIDQAVVILIYWGVQYLM
jgi:pyruvate/oxaloacetate carboxyltransferase